MFNVRKDKCVWSFAATLNLIYIGVKLLSVSYLALDSGARSKLMIVSFYNRRALDSGARSKLMIVSFYNRTACNVM